MEEAAVLPILGVDGTSLLMADQELQSVITPGRGSYGSDSQPTRLSDYDFG